MRSTIFHILLRIYLRPRPSHPLLFGPALALISAHASSIDAIEVFDLLPPLVALSDIRVFLEKTLRRSGERAREAKVVRSISRSLLEAEEKEVVDLEERRVKITDSRVCVFFPPCFFFLCLSPRSGALMGPSQVPALSQAAGEQRDCDPLPLVSHRSVRAGEVGVADTFCYVAARSPTTAAGNSSRRVLSRHA